MKPKQLAKLINILQLFSVQLCTQYGMTECNTALGCQLQNLNNNFVPLGYPLPGYRCLLINKQGRIIDNTKNSSEIGQIHIGGLEYLFLILLEIGF
jgi:acyl-coenzyme A synthetase/AMP-(fatty) acid ligase